MLKYLSHTYRNYLPFSCFMRCNVWGKKNEIMKDHCDQSCHHGDFSKVHLPLARTTPAASCLGSPFTMGGKLSSCFVSIINSYMNEQVINCSHLNFCSGRQDRYQAFCFPRETTSTLRMPGRAGGFLTVGVSVLLSAGKLVLCILLAVVYLPTGVLLIAFSGGSWLLLLVAHLQQLNMEIAHLRWVAEVKGCLMI